MPKIVDREQEQHALLDACFRTFAELGYAAASMRKLARAAGVSTGKLYHYFPDKPSILGALFQHLVEQDRARVQVGLVDGAPVPTRIRALFGFYRENMAYLRDLLRLAQEVHRYEPEARSRTEVRQAVQQYRDGIAEVLGIDGPLADMAFGWLLGSLTLGTLDPEAVDLDAQEQLTIAAWHALDGVL